MSRRHGRLDRANLAAWLLTACVLLSGAAHAQEGGSASSAQPLQPLKMAVSEGTSGGIDAETARKKYRPLADRLSAALDRPVEVLFVREFSLLERGMQEQFFDLVIARPSDYPARGLRDYGYRYVATSEPEGHCLLVVPDGSPLQGIADLKGRSFILPEEVAYMTRFCRAELRDHGIDLAYENVHYVREQGAIPFALENGIAEVGGLASYSGAARQWQAKGHRVLHESVAQPYMPVVASPILSVQQVTRIQAVLAGLQQDEVGRQFLKTLNITGFTARTEDRLRALLQWLGV